MCDSWPVKDIDVNINPGKRQGQYIAIGYEVINRWISILPESHVHNYDKDRELGFPPSIVTFTDQTKQEFDLDIFINQDGYWDTEEVEWFNVVSLDKLVTSYYQLLKDYKIDHTYITNNNQDGGYNQDCW